MRGKKLFRVLRSMQDDADFRRVSHSQLGFTRNASLSFDPLFFSKVALIVGIDYVLHLTGD
jgi:hypothetical protein